MVGLFAYLLSAAERKLCLVFQNLSLCLPGYGKRRTREETAHHILAEKLMLIPDFSIPLGCSQSCFLEDCNCSLPAGVRGFFFSSLPHLCCMLFTTDWFENVEAILKYFGVLFCFQCEDDLSQSEQGTTEIAPEYGPEDRVDVRYLQWLNGRLRFQWRSLHAQHQEQCKLLHKVNDSCNLLWHCLLFKSLVS